MNSGRIRAGITASVIAATVGTTAFVALPAAAFAAKGKPSGHVAKTTTSPTPTATTSPTATASTTATTFTTQALTNPARVVVSDSAGVAATFTVGARTVSVRGSTRIFAEPSGTTATVTSTTWVRLLPVAFSGSVDLDWLQRELADTSPDVLAVAMQYQPGAGVVRDSSGRQIAGDASYGPLLADGTRQEGSDFNDYLGVTWNYADGSVDAPESAQLGDLDCSGYVRMVYGYRSGYSLALTADGRSLPRRAAQMEAGAPGPMIITDTGVTPTNLSGLLPGDLVFFDASTDDGTAIDHVGIYLGKDSTGNYRFVSSRKKADGPTFGDNGGRAVLTGSTYYWAKAFRSARRI